ncbi:Lsr2 family DNA-binding protein [Nocardia sp. NPDC055049]
MFAANAATLRESFDQWAPYARRTGRTKGSARRHVPTSLAGASPRRNDLSAIRAWANENGYDVSDRGRRGLQGAFLRRKWRMGSTQQDRRATPAPALVNRDFTADEPDRLWVADATRIVCGEGVFWPAAVRDAFSNSDRGREVFGPLRYPTRAPWSRVRGLDTRCS